MLQKMYKKLNKKGFTLMEMLIVVAIIAILVAIAIPTFTGSLSKAKEATDEANNRALKAIVIADYMLTGKVHDQEISTTNEVQVYLSSDGQSYGSSTSGTEYKATTGVVGAKVKLNDKGELDFTFNNQTSSSTPTTT
jgi:prepilin-type N-terminal cleavage/methylation domain-containing protein